MVQFAPPASVLLVRVMLQGCSKVAPKFVVYGVNWYIACNIVLYIDLSEHGVVFDISRDLYYLPRLSHNPITEEHTRQITVGAIENRQRHSSGDKGCQVPISPRHEIGGFGAGIGKEENLGCQECIAMADDAWRQLVATEHSGTTNDPSPRGRGSKDSSSLCWLHWFVG